jgi:hypothetical protein
MDQALLIEFESDLITQNQWREALGLDTVAGRDLYYSELVAQGIIKPKPSAAPAANVSSDTAAANSNNQNSNPNGNGN